MAANKVTKPNISIMKLLGDSNLDDIKDWANNKASITTLVNTLKYLSHVYYNSDEELVSDEIFDAIKDILKDRAPNNKFLQEIGAPVTKDAVKLPYPMASLDKIVTDTKKLNKWIEKYSGPYVWSDKLDGVSGLLVKENDELKLYTRGNGIEGQDVTHLIKYVLQPKTLKNLPNGIAIRGELIMSKANFEKVKKSNDLKNARNTVAGLVNAKHPNEQLIKLVDFIGYNVLSNNLKISKQLEKLEDLNFPVVNWVSKKKIDEELLIKYFNDRIKESEYEIDGIVVIDDSVAHKLENNENPDYGFAFKNKDVLDIAEVEITDIEWHGSKDSYLIPTVIIEPTELDGVTVTRATGHNAKFIKDNKLGKGSIIKIIRSGAVIPHIVETVKGTGAEMPNIPKNSYKWSETGVDIIYTGKQKEILDEIATNYVTFFFRKIGVKFLSEGIVSKLVNEGYKTPIDVISADVNELYKIHGLGKKNVDKIFKNIDEAFYNIKLETLMAASNMFGRGLGSKKLALILKNYPDLLDSDWSEKTIEEKVLKIKGFDVLTANRFAQNFKYFVNFYEDLREVIDFDLYKKPTPIAKAKAKAKTINKESQVSDDNSSVIDSECNIFANKSIVFTGFRNAEMEEFIESCGGKVTTSVSKNTFMLVHAETDNITSNAKYIKAKELGIKLMTASKFESTYL